MVQKRVYRAPSYSSAESHVPQASETLRAPASDKLPPEGAALGAPPPKKPNGAAVVQSTHCTAANASSVECATSTQQARPLAK
jgi:hypothetical protein